MKARILLVEDNAVDADLVREAFRELEGSFQLDVAVNGEDGLAILKNSCNRHDFVLLDLNMPRMTGIEMLQELRKLEGITGITPVVILTNSQSSEDVSRAYRAGANAYIRKPLGIEGLIEKIRNVSIFWLKTATRPFLPTLGSPSMIPPSS